MALAHIYQMAKVSNKAIRELVLEERGCCQDGLFHLFREHFVFQGGKKLYSVLTFWAAKIDGRREWVKLVACAYYNKHIALVHKDMGPV